MASPKKLTPAQIVRRVRSLVGGTVSPGYLKKEQKKMDKGGSVKKTKARTRKK